MLLGVLKTPSSRHGAKGHQPSRPTVEGGTGWRGPSDTTFAARVPSPGADESSAVQTLAPPAQASPAKSPRDSNPGISSQSISLNQMNSYTCSHFSSPWFLKAAIWIVQIKEHQHSSAADTADSLPSSAGDQLRRNTLLSGEAFPWSHRAFSFNIHLAASFGLLAQLLLCEGDVGIHQASSNTDI